MAGLPCVIVRLSGCDLSCSYCDTGYAKDEGEDMTVRSVVDTVGKTGIRRALVTGGEPLQQEGSVTLMNALLNAGFEVVLETNGAVDISVVPHNVHIVMDLKTPGSGCDTRNLLENLDLLKESDEIKIVLTGREDYLWAREMIEEHDLTGRFAVTLSPVHGELDPARLAAWILEDRLEAALGIQLHKYIFGADKRRV